MIRFKEIKSSDAELYSYMERLLVETFPENEYRPADQALPVMICCYGDLTPEKDFEEVKSCLYKEVYHLG